MSPACRVAAILALSLLPTVLAAPSAEADVSRTTSGFVLAVIPMDEDGKPSGKPDITTLGCRPPTGQHPHAREACRVLASVDGNINRIPPSSLACTLEMAPVKVVALGMWRDESRHYLGEYSNRCLANAHTGDIFDY